jgi:hypothetical protein
MEIKIIMTMMRKFFKSISLVFLVSLRVKFYSVNFKNLNNYLFAQIKKFKMLKILNNN